MADENLEEFLNDIRVSAVAQKLDKYDEVFDDEDGLPTDRFLQALKSQAPLSELDILVDEEPRYDENGVRVGVSTAVGNGIRRGYAGDHADASAGVGHRDLDAILGLSLSAAAGPGQPEQHGQHGRRSESEGSDVDSTAQRALAHQAHHARAHAHAQQQQQQKQQQQQQQQPRARTVKHTATRTSSSGQTPHAMRRKGGGGGGLSRPKSAPVSRATGGAHSTKGNRKAKPTAQIRAQQRTSHYDLGVARPTKKSAAAAAAATAGEDDEDEDAGHGVAVAAETKVRTMVLRLRGLQEAVRVLEVQLGEALGAVSSKDDALNAAHARIRYSSSPCYNYSPNRTSL